MGKWVYGLSQGAKIKRWFLQCYVDRESVLTGGLSAPAKEEMEEYGEILGLYTETMSLRGMD